TSGAGLRPCAALPDPPMSASTYKLRLARAGRAGGSFMAGGKRVGLFVTCLVDLMRPSVGFAAAKLLADAGCVVEVPRQACCGQPGFNSGDRATARAVAEQVIET